MSDANTPEAVATQAITAIAAVTRSAIGALYELAAEARKNLTAQPPEEAAEPQTGTQVNTALNLQGQVAPAAQQLPESLDKLVAQEDDSAVIGGDPETHGTANEASNLQSLSPNDRVRTLTGQSLPSAPAAHEPTPNEIVNSAVAAPPATSSEDAAQTSGDAESGVGAAAPSGEPVLKGE